MAGEQQFSNRRSLVDYCDRFAALNVSKRQKGNAPYKPILLLSVIDLIEEGIITDNKISVSDELVNTFNKYWKILGNDSYAGGLHYPFFHLKRDRFWHIEFRDDFDGFQPKTLRKLQQAVVHAKLDDELFEFLQDQNARKKLTDTLILTWFSDEIEEVESIVTINQNFQDEISERIHSKETDDIGKKKYRLKKSVVRDSFFRKSVVHIYNYQCAFCGLNVSRSLRENLLDGAHIKPFSQFYNNQIDNGISFCKNHHWAFDMGWFTIDNNYKIIVASDITESQSMNKPMREFDGQSIFLPSFEQYYPSVESIQWHRYNIFRT